MRLTALALAVTLLGMASAAAGAQTPVVPPAHPTRPARPTPPAAPMAPSAPIAPAPWIGETFGPDFSGIDLDAEQMTAQAQRLAQQAQRLVSSNMDAEELRELREEARDAAQAATQAARAGIDAGSGYGFGYGAGDGLAAAPRAAWAQGDPGDSLYRVARDTFNRGDYRRAAQLFADLAQKYPHSAYVSDSQYFQALALYKLGSTDDLQAAAKVIEPAAATTQATTRRGFNYTDAPALYARINHALAMRGDRAAQAAIQRQAAQGGGSCDQEDQAVRAEALNALSQMDPNEALPLLRKVLERKDDCSANLRRNAVYILGRRADTAAAALMTDVARNDPNIDVRTSAITFLSRMPGDAGIATLEGMLRSDTSERVQRAAVRALMASDDPKARESMRALIERKDAPLALRMEAINTVTMGDRGMQDDGAYLRGLYGRVDNDELKRTIVDAVGRIGTADNDQWLLGIAKNSGEPSGVRAAALARLARSNIATADLAKLYDTADSRTMRYQVIRALQIRKDSAATDKLIDIAKNSTDVSMRTEAIRVLSSKNDPRATKALLDLIDRNP